MSITPWLSYFCLYTFLYSRISKSLCVPSVRSHGYATSQQQSVINHRVSLTIMLEDIYHSKLFVSNWSPRVIAIPKSTNLYIRLDIGPRQTFPQYRPTHIRWMEPTKTTPSTSYFNLLSQYRRDNRKDISESCTVCRRHGQHRTLLYYITTRCIRNYASIHWQTSLERARCFDRTINSDFSRDNVYCDRCTG